MGAPKIFAQSTTNSDFNPFPQMEQDQNSTDQQMAPSGGQQNDDTWPPANSDASSNSQGAS